MRLSDRPVQANRTVNDYNALHTGKLSPEKKTEKTKRKSKAPKKVVLKKVVNKKVGWSKNSVIKVLQTTNGRWSVTPHRVNGEDDTAVGVSPELT